MAVAALLAFGVLAHGLLVLTDYQLWDAWWIWRGVTLEAEFPKLLAFNAEWARPLDLWLYWVPFAKVFGWTEAGVVAAKVFGVVCWVGAGPMVYCWMRRGLGTDVVTSFSVCLLAVCLPLFDVIGDITFAMYACSFFLFWAGCALFAAHYADSSLSPQPSLVKSTAVRGGCLLLFFLAFNLNSLLPFFYAVAGAVLLFRCRFAPGAWIRGGLYALRRWPDFALFPVAYFLAKNHWFPQSGHYSDYNRPSMEPQRLIDGLASFALFLRDEVAFAVGSNFGVVFALFLAVFVVFLLSRNKKWAETWLTPEETGDGKLIIAGLGLLVAAWFPYASVGQDFASEGYASRNTILMGVPLGMIIFGIGRPVITSLCRARSWLVAGGLSLVVSLAIFANIRTYLGLQAFGAKQESVVRALERHKSEVNPTLIQLRDYFPLPHSINYYPPSIWTLLLARSEASATTFVVDTRPFAPDGVVTNADGSRSLQVPVIPIDSNGLFQLKESTTMPSFMSEIPQTGTQVLAVVSPGSLGTDPQMIGIKYLVTRLFARSRLDQFINSLAIVQVEAVPDVGTAPN